MANGLVANETTVLIALVTFGDGLINSAQVQVDSIVQVVRQSPVLYRKLYTRYE